MTGAGAMQITKKGTSIWLIVALAAALGLGWYITKDDKKKGKK
jgi:hypothetical protein